MQIVPCAPDGLVDVIAKKRQKPFGKIKVFFDSTCVLISLILSLLILHNLGGFGLATFISCLFLGRIMGLIEKMLKKRLHQIAFGG